jgi:hypothetical protein
MPPGVQHAQRLQGSKGAAEPWLARDVGLIHCGGEAIRLGEAVERFAPGTLVRGCEQHAVHVEDARDQRLGLAGPGSRWSADGHGAGATSKAVPAWSSSVRPPRATATSPWFAASEASRSAAPSHASSNAPPR